MGGREGGVEEEGEEREGRLARAVVCACLREGRKRGGEGGKEG